MIPIKKGSTEEKILRLLLKKYPVTSEEIVKALHIRETVIMESLRSMELSGILALDVLPGKCYIRLQRRDFEFSGFKPDQKRTIVRKKEKRKKGFEREIKNDDDTSGMYR